MLSEKSQSHEVMLGFHLYHILDITNFIDEEKVSSCQVLGIGKGGCVYKSIAQRSLGW